MTLSVSHCSMRTETRNIDARSQLPASRSHVPCCDALDLSSGDSGRWWKSRSNQRWRQSDGGGKMAMTWMEMTQKWKLLNKPNSPYRMPNQKYIWFSLADVIMQWDWIPWRGGGVESDWVYLPTFLQLLTVYRLWSSSQGFQKLHVGVLLITWWSQSSHEPPATNSWR